MKTVLLLALAALPLTACGGAIEDEGSTDGRVGTSESDLTATFTELVDFDHDPSGNAIADGTAVDNVYSSLGVTLSSIVCTSSGCTSGQHAYARTWGSTNIASLFASPTVPVFDARSGAVRADFATPRTWVSIDATPVLPPEYFGTPASQPWIEAYDANNNKIGSSVYYPIAYGAAGYGSQQTLKIDAGSAIIKYVRFSSQYSSSSPAVYAALDNLRFNGATVIWNPPPIKILEPAVIAH
ncbi:MAG TPA: hypothetical protein VHC69_07265 [Polyangiaceae bacterium]|nr:hypothetical protein [Polyangiaceae bacterium]